MQAGSGRARGLLGTVLASSTLTLVLGGCVPAPGTSTPTPRPAPSATATSVSASPSATDTASATETASATSSASPTPQTSASAMPSSSSASATAPASVGAAPGYRTTTVSGQDGGLRWTVRIPEFSGTGAATTINSHVRASADDGIARSRHNARNDSSGERRTLTGSSQVTTNDGRTVQVVITFVDSLEGSAHPTTQVNTSVLQAGDGAPVTLGQVFTDESAALTTLGPVVRRLAEAAGEPVTESGGLDAREANWAAWQTSDDGMTFFFQAYQLGGNGERSYTVAWDTVRPLLTPTAQQLLAPA